jgi:hypothetical protein
MPTARHQPAGWNTMALLIEPASTISTTSMVSDRHPKPPREPGFTAFIQHLVDLGPPPDYDGLRPQTSASPCRGKLLASFRSTMAWLPIYHDDLTVIALQKGRA